MKKTTKRAMLASGLLGVATVGVLTSGGFAYAKTGSQDTARTAITRPSAQRGMKLQHQKHHQERLAQLVADGKLTQTQADKLTAKEKEMEPKREAAHNETDATKRRVAMNTIKAEMEQWAKDNGIDLSTIRPGRDMHGPGGVGMGRMMHNRDRDDAPPAQ